MFSSLPAVNLSMTVLLGHEKIQSCSKPEAEPSPDEGRALLCTQDVG